MPEEDVETETPQEAEYQVKIDGGGLSFEQSVPQAVVGQLMSILLGGSPPTIGSPAPKVSGVGSPASISHPSERLSVQEFVIETTATRNVDTIVAIAAFLDVHEGKKDFTSAEIKGRFRSAGLPAPANFTRDFGAAVSAGWIASVPGDDKTYFVTRTGREVVDAKFPSEMRKSSQPTGRRKRSKKDAS